jgi:hypothetical protein
MKTSFLVLIALSATAIAAIVGAQQNIINGDFSDGLSGWNTQGPAVVENGVLRLSDGGILWQNFTASGYPVGAYEFSYDFKLSAPVEAWRLSINGDGFKASMGEVTSGPPLFFLVFDAVHTRTPVQADTWYHMSITAPSRYETATLTLTSASSSFTGMTSESAAFPSGGRIQFQELGTATHGDLQIDNIGLWQVPEPSAALLAAIGAMAIAIRRRQGHHLVQLPS